MIYRRFSNPSETCLPISSFGLCSTVKNFGMGRYLQLCPGWAGTFGQQFSSSFSVLALITDEVRYYTKCRTPSISELQIHSYLTQQELTSNDYKKHTSHCNVSDLCIDWSHFTEVTRLNFKLPSAVFCTSRKFQFYMRFRYVIFCAVRW